MIYQEQDDHDRPIDLKRVRCGGNEEGEIDK